jgi:hypothetical protein
MIAVKNIYRLYTYSHRDTVPDVYYILLTYKKCAISVFLVFTRRGLWFAEWGNA